MRKRTAIPLFIILAVLAAFGIMAYLRAKAPPEAARLLPESDAIVYVHLKQVRELTHFDQTPVHRTPYFQQFIDATGIVPERDLDSAAFALHRMSDPHGPNGPVAYSEVFIGRFDGVRLGRYLARLASSTESYAGSTIYTIPVGEPAGRNLRVALLGYDTIAASNMPTTEQIHSMLDRSRASALATPGCSLLSSHFHDVPLLSEAWGIGHIGLPFSENGFINVLGLQLPLPEDTDLVASLRYTGAAHMLSGGAVHLRIDEIAPDPTTAQRTVDDLTSLLTVLRGIAANQPARTDGDTALRSVLDSIKLTQHNDHALLNANASLDQLKSLANTHNPSDATPIADPASK
jgi:hypothetical protein